MNLNTNSTTSVTLGGGALDWKIHALSAPKVVQYNYTSLPPPGMDSPATRLQEYDIQLRSRTCTT